MFKSMFYPKNVPNIERVLRIVLGVFLIAAAAFAPTWFGSSSPLLAGILIFSALFVFITGFVG